MRACASSRVAARARGAVRARASVDECGTDDAATRARHSRARSRVARMASRGARVAGTDGSDHAYRQRVEARYAVKATARRRVEMLMRVNGTVWFLIALVTFLSARATLGGVDGRSMRTIVVGALGGGVSFAGGGRVRERSGTGATRACAAACAAAAACRGAMETWARVTNADEHVSASWLWSEGVSAVLERFLGVKVPPGGVYPACVSAEVLCELTLALLPLGSYVMCIGIDGQTMKKEK